MNQSIYDYAIYLLSRTPKTVQQMQQKLLMKGYTMEETTNTIHKLTQQNYLNDYAFCEAYVRSTMIHKGKSFIYTKNKLYEKGIPKDISEQVLGNLDSEIQEALIKNLKTMIRKLLNSGKDIVTIYEKLTRQGHRYDDIKTALQQMQD